jgi:hypothetical protein
MRFTIHSPLVVILCLAVSPAIFGSGDVKFVIGQRFLDDDWEPAEDQVVVGVDLNLGCEDCDLDFVVGVSLSNGDGSGFDPGTGSFDQEGTIREFSFGVMKVWDRFSQARPFISGGASYIYGKSKLSIPGSGSISLHDTTVGIFVDGGVFWRVGERFNIGFDVRIVRARELEIHLSSIGLPGETLEVNTDYEQLGLILGWGW